MTSRPCGKSLNTEFVFIEQKPERAGNARHLIFVDDLDALVAEIAERGLDPAERETLSNGVRKVAYRDRDGNEVGLAALPSDLKLTP